MLGLGYALAAAIGCSSPQANGTGAAGGKGSLPPEVQKEYTEGLDLASAITLAVTALGHDSDEVREISAEQLEVATLDRTRSQSRKFKRMSAERLAEAFTGSGKGG